MFNWIPLSEWLEQVKWGTVAEWLGAVGTISAAVAAVWLGVRAVRTDKFREARSVRAWAYTVGEDNESAEFVRLFNGSSMPLPDVSLLGQNFGENGHISASVKNVEPGCSVTIQTPLEWDRTITFIDSSGTEWHVDEKGKVRERSRHGLRVRRHYATRDQAP